MTRYTVVIDDAMVETLDRLKKAYGLKTKADVFDLGVTVLWWMAQQQKNGYEVGRKIGDDPFQPLLIPQAPRVMK